MSCTHEESVLGFPAMYPAPGWEQGPQDWVCSTCGKYLGRSPRDQPLVHYHPDPPLPPIMPELLEG
jgi:hypothetical protein